MVERVLDVELTLELPDDKVELDLVELERLSSDELDNVLNVVLD